MNSYVNSGSKKREQKLLPRKYPIGYNGRQKDWRPSGVITNKDGGYINISTVGYQTIKGANTYLRKDQHRK